MNNNIKKSEKNQQTKNYLKIAKIAEGNGIKISEHIK